MIRALAVALLLLASPALAQQQPDPAAMQKAIQALQAQRNAALDQAAGAQVQAATLAEENTKLKAQIEELKKKAAADTPATGGSSRP